MLQRRLKEYFGILGRMAGETSARDAAGRDVPLSEATAWAIDTARATHERGNKMIFIGNGGSASICSHMAIDYSKNGNLRAMALNDGAALTCLGNDLGYDQVFAMQISMHAMPGDLLVAISSSGRSPNILNGVAAARERNCRVLTLSGFDPDNPLRGLGEMNLYVPSSEYGFVEITHLTLCHAILDLAMGWEGAASIGSGLQAAGGPHG